MGVKINNREKLDSNAYKMILIKEDNGEFFVKVNGAKSGDKYEPVTVKLSDILKGLPDDKKIIYIVDSFLESTRIDRLEEDVSNIIHNGRSLCNGKAVVINGDRPLYLQINNSELLRHVIKMAKLKYDRDRYSYVSDNIGDEYSISLCEKKSSYGMEFISCENCEENCLGTCPKILTFNLMCSNGKMLSFDKAFIERFIYDKLWEYGQVAAIYEDKKDIKLVDGATIVGSYVSSYLICCGELTIKFNCGVFNKGYILDFCNQIISRYNGELEEINKYKKRQLKMEGF